MEEKKIGMGWYEFLRYFTYGLGRIPFLLVAAVFLLLALESKEVYFLLVSLMGLLYFAVLFVVHRHLEHYSCMTRKMVTYPYLMLAVLNLINLVLSIMVEPEEVTSYALSLALNIFWFVVNYEYFKKRSHIFVNKCNILGTIIGDPIVVEPVQVSAQQEAPSEQQEISYEQHEYKFCRICGRKMEMDDMFCSQCGTKVLEEEGE